MDESHGRFVWYVLMTTDVEAAKEFYTKVIGWSARDASMPGLEYAVFTAGEAPICGVMSLPKDLGSMDKRPGWIGYVKVDDVDATTDRIKQRARDRNTLFNLAFVGLLPGPSVIRKFLYSVPLQRRPNSATISPSPSRLAQVPWLKTVKTGCFTGTRVSSKQPSYTRKV